MLTPTTARRSSVLRRPVLIAAISLTSLFFVGCDKPEEIRAYGAPKAPSAVKEVAATQFTPNDFQSLAPAAPKPAGPEMPTGPIAQGPAAAPAAPAAPKADGPAWDVPKGWTELPASGMRYASFRVSAENPDVQLTVIPLPPQPVRENVNRWEGQIDAPHTPADKINDVAKKVDLAGGATAHVVDLSGPGTTGSGPKQRILGAMVEFQGRMWFFKLQGADTVVGPQKEAFDAFVKSIRFGGDKKAAVEPLTEKTETVPVAAPAAAAADGSEAITKYKAPAGWEEDKTPRPLRLMTFRLKEGDKAGEVSVLKLGKDNIGSLLDNVNRWRAQAGAGPVPAVNEADIPKVSIAGKEALYFEIAGPDDKAPTKRMLLAMALRGDDVYFFKLLGDAGLVAGQKEAFSQFLKSVEFGK